MEVTGTAPVGAETGFGVKPGSELVAGEDVSPETGAEVPYTGLGDVPDGLFTGLDVDPSRGDGVDPP